MKKFLFLTMTMLLTTFAWSQDWVGLTTMSPTEPEIRVTRSDNQQVNLTVELSGFFSTLITEAGVDYQRLSIPGCGATGIVGEPELPVIRKSIAVPVCTQVNYFVQVVTSQTLNNYLIYPAPELQLDSIGMLQEIFTINPSAYQQNTFVPAQNYIVTETGALRNQQFVVLEIYPIFFNPVSEQLEVVTEMEITLTFVNPTTDVNVQTGIFNKVAASTFINYVDNGISALINDRAYLQPNFTPGIVTYYYLTDTIQACNIVADYLIIADPQLLTFPFQNSEIIRLANHRAYYNGFDVAVVTVNQILALDFIVENPNPIYINEQKIRTFIRRVYEGKNAHHMLDSLLAYVLLVGDYENDIGIPGPKEHQIAYDNNPSNENFIYPADYYYSCITKDANGGYDNNGDLLIGRFSVQNNTQLLNMVQKTINHETNFSDLSWRKSVGTTIAPSLSANSWTGYLNAVTPLIEGNGYTHNVVNYYDDGEVIRETTLEYLNTGVVYMQYMGIGNSNYGFTPTDWYDNLTKDTFELKLHNDYYTPFITAIYPISAYFDDEYCLAEFLTSYSPIKGAVGYIGNSRAIILAGAGGGSNNNLFQYHFPVFLFGQNVSIAGELLLACKMAVPSTGWGLLQNKYAFNLFGDPALNILAEGGEEVCPLYLTETMYIEDGDTYTIPCDTVYCAEGVSIIVKPGGTLIIDGSTITNMDSGRMWQGIKIMNDRTRYGTVIIKNEATIANAVCGVYVANQLSLNVEDSYFINNTIGIKIDFLKNPLASFGDKTYITNTDFIINENYLEDPLYFNAHVIANNSIPVLVTGCRFLNTNLVNPLMYYPDEMIVGIKSFNTSLSVVESNFSGLLTGISVRNSGSSPSTYIYDNTFSENYCGIKVNGVNSPSIWYNNFTNSFLTSTGLYVEQSTGYKIIENRFKQDTISLQTIGIKIANSGRDENVVKNNYFNKIDVGINAVGINSSQVNNDPTQRICGLQFLCNGFVDTKTADILVGYFPYPPQPIIDHSVRREQGRAQEPAGNKFWGQNRINIANHSDYNLYYYYNVNAPEEFPYSVTGLVYLIPTNSINYCISYAPAFTSEELELILAQYDEWNEQYEYWLAQLLGNNIDNEDDYLMILSNISYYSALKDNYFNTIITTIQNVWYEVGGTRYEMENSLYETLRFLFSYRNNYTDNLSIAETYLAEVNYKEALATIANMYALFELKGEQADVWTIERVDELMSLEIYIKWLQQLEEKSETIFNLPENEIDFLIKFIETNTGRGVVFANNILCGLYNICIEKGSIENKSPQHQTEESIEFLNNALQIDSKTLLNNISVIPNPTTGELKIISGELIIDKVEVLDIVGKVVSSNHLISLSSNLKIDISHLNSGIYFVKVITKQGETIKKIIKQ